MNWHAFGFFLLTNLILSLTPGPAVLLVSGHAAANGWRRCQASVFGILSGNAVYCLLSAAGLGMVFLRFPMLSHWIRAAGVAYLAWLGARALWTAHRPLVLQEVGAIAPGRVLYRQALVLQLSNPKSVLFFCALLPQFTQEGQGIAAMLLLGFCAIMLEYPVLTGYSILGAQLRRLAARGHAVYALNLLSASLLLLAAGRLGLA